MKKVFLMIAAALVGMSAMAQVQFGLKVGFDMTNFWGSDVPHGVKPSYQVGALMEYKFTDKFAIAPEVVFASQGGQFKAIKDVLGIDLGSVGLADLDKNITYYTNYINVPVMLKFYATPSFAIDFGPQVGFNVYSKATAGDGDDKYTADLKDGTKTVDFGLGLGATYSLTENAFVQARYTLGLTNVFDGDADCKNGNVQVAFGWKF